VQQKLLVCHSTSETGPKIFIDIASVQKFTASIEYDIDTFQTSHPVISNTTCRTIYSRSKGPTFQMPETVHEEDRGSFFVVPVQKALGPAQHLTGAHLRLAFWITRVSTPTFLVT
jgi:hypothetical protein